MRKEGAAACPATAFAARRLLPAIMPAAATVVCVLLAALLLLGTTTSGGSAAAGGAAGPALAARRLALDPRERRPAAGRARAAAPAAAELLQAQVVFRHGARTPLATLYYPDDFAWTNCAAGMSYAGARLALRDAAGGGVPPPITDRDSPALPGGCAAGILTEQGWRVAPAAACARVRARVAAPAL